jgi:hypothetical protein
MTSHPAYRIRGVIKDAVSYKNLGVRLMNGEDAVGNRVLINTSSGEFQVYDVMPGSYTLQAYSRDRIVAVGEASVTVKDQEVIGVEVTLSTGVDVQGTIERVGIDQNRAIPADDVNSYRQNAPRHMPNEPVQVVILQPGRIPITGTQPPAAVDADGHFTLRDMLPGNYAFVLSTFNEYVTSIRSGSVEVLADGLEIGTTSPAEIRVTLGSNGGIIHGIVTGLRAGEAATIALIRAAGIAGVPTIARTVIGQNSESTFFTGNLAPGEYLLYAWPSGQDVEYRNPEALRALSGNAVAVSLREHGNEQVTLKAIFQEIQ